MGGALKEEAGQGGYYTLNAMRMGFGLNVGNSKISIWESNIAVGRHENDFFSLKQTFMIWLIIIFIMLML